MYNTTDKHFGNFGRNSFKKQTLWPFFIKIVVISCGKYLATLVTPKAGSRWLGGPRTWTLGPQLYNTLHLIHSIHVNKNIDLF